MSAWKKHERFIVCRWLRGVQQFWDGYRWTCELNEGQLFSDLPTAEHLAEELDGLVIEN